MKYPNYSRKLLRLFKRDEMYRNAPFKSDKWYLQYKKLDPQNFRRLSRIVDEIGWPTVSKVGKNASIAAIYISQHSTLIKESVALLRIARRIYERNPQEIIGTNLAHWIDAMNMQRKEPQLFGSYLIGNTKGVFEIYQIEDPMNLESRRKIYGFTEKYCDYVCKLITNNPKSEISIKESYKRLLGKKLHCADL